MQVNYSALPNESMVNYYEFLINKVFKALPMKEEGNPDLIKYLDSLKREIIGNMALVNNLKFDGYFITLLNKIQFLINEDYTNAVCRKTVFECIDLVNKLKSEYKI